MVQHYLKKCWHVGHPKFRPSILNIQLADFRQNMIFFRGLQKKGNAPYSSFILAQGQYPKFHARTQKSNVT